MSESLPVINQTSVIHIDLSALTPEELARFIEALRAEGLLDETDEV